LLLRTTFAPLFHFFEKLLFRLGIVKEIDPADFRLDRLRLRSSGR